MVADATETRNVIPSLGFKTCMTIKFQVFTVLSRFEFKDILFRNRLQYFSFFISIL